MAVMANMINAPATPSHSVRSARVTRLPYGLVALGLRLLMARIFFLPGQSKIEGPMISLSGLGFDFSVILPMNVKDATLHMFETQYANLPLPTATAAYLFSYAEFVLPICLVLGFATRFAALALVIMVALIQIYVMPEAWWSTHVYWISILLVLITVGPGGISLDGLIHHLHQKT